MRDLDVIRKLIKELDELSIGDGDKLKDIKLRTEKIVKKLHGETNKYLNELNVIRFVPRSVDAREELQFQIWYSGKSIMLSVLNSLLEEQGGKIIPNIPDCMEESDAPRSNKVFVVHGHDEGMKLSVARTLEKLGLQPIILHEQPSEGRTIIEQFTHYSDVSFAVVLLSPDDWCYEKGQSKYKKSRARQNVIFELGFFIGKLGRNSVSTLYYEENSFDMPSDYSGVLHTKYDKAGYWQIALVQELKARGYSIDSNRLYR